MHCRRCNGLMYRVELRDVASWEWRAMAAECLFCSEIVDPVIWRNRNRAEPPTRKDFHQHRPHGHKVGRRLWTHE